MRFLTRSFVPLIALATSLLLSHSGLSTAGVSHAEGLAQAVCTISWAVNADGFWDVAGNWSTGVVPGPSDDVCIDVTADVTVTHRQDTSTVNSVRGEEALVLSGGTLNVSTTIQISNAFTLDGGTLQNGTLLAGAGGAGLVATNNADNRLVGVTLEGDLDLSAFYVRGSRAA